MKKIIELLIATSIGVIIGIFMMVGVTLTCLEEADLRYDQLSHILLQKEYNE